MITHFSPLGERSLSWVDNMIDMIERCAPRMMRIGGSACGAASETAGKAIPKETLEQIKAMHFEGLSALQISQRTGYHQQTIYRFTRPWREARTRRAKA